MPQYNLEGKESISWSKLQPGDEVYTAGNLNPKGEPTCCYGPHFVVDSVHRILKNAIGMKFHERYPYVFKRGEQL